MHRNVSQRSLAPQQPFEDCEFRKSSATGTDRYACVEVAQRPDVVAVRSTTDPERHTLYFTRDEWAAFIIGAKRGEFDLHSA